MPITERFGLVQTSPPADEPLTLSEAKTHCRVEVADDDAYIAGLITAARQRCELEIDRSFVTQSWRLTLDEFCEEIPLPRGPHQSVASVEYYDQADNLQTLATTFYEVDVASDPAVVRRAYATIWPIVRERKPGAVLVTFTAGYGNAAAVPGPIKQAIKQLIGHMYENREPVVTGSIATPLPMTVQWLLQPYWNGDY